MDRYLKYFFSIRKSLLWLLLFFVTIYFLIELVLVRYQEFFVGGHKIGVFFSSLSISYVASFVFYFIVVHIKEQNDKENINEYVGIKVNNIITSAHLYIQPLQRLKDNKARFEDLDMNKLHEILDSVKRKDVGAPIQINGSSGTWLQWYEYLKKSSKSSIDEIFMRYSHLDSELIRLLTRIDNSLFYTQWDHLYSDHIFESFAMYEIQLRGFLKHINDLEKYRNQNLSTEMGVTSEYLGLEGVV